MQLAEANMLNIEDPLRKHLDCFSTIKVAANGSIVNANKDITIKHLLTMCGGFSYDLGSSGIVNAVQKFFDVSSR